MSGPPLVVSVHDVAPATAEATRTWVADLDERGVPASLLVVPGPWRGPGLADAPDLAAWLRHRAADGHEVAQHGWVHAPATPGPVWRWAVNRVVSRGCGEFWALDHEQARVRLQRGRTVLWDAGLDPCGFTPPGWLASNESLLALHELGYRYTTSHRGVLDLVHDERWTVPALSNRPGGRGERLGTQVMGRAARRGVARGRGARIALHPDDLDRPGLREATLTAIDACLEAGAEPVPYATLVARRPAATAV